MSAIVVHPEFDPTTATWFWDEYEAPTLRELQRLLGPQVTIADWYPGGMDIVIKNIRLTREQVIWHCAREVRLNKRDAGTMPKMRRQDRQTPNPAWRTAPRPQARKYDYDQVVRLRASGLKFREVARAYVGEPRPSVATCEQICRRAHQLGDHRAQPGNKATRRALSQQRSENDVHQAS